ncbi:MAG TPA: aminotransferase class III-fold pyridoxal phosphate-dependent enzyme [bacterium]|nr:aminotransferase class III-fold pyridoxal phosphate-dependent enzyme [bacterium]
MALYKYDKSQELFKRATQLIPGGIYGHFTPALTVPGAFPYYAARGEGPRYWDVDGNEFIDYMCAYGPMVIGHNNPNVQKAVKEQMEFGSTFNHPGEVMIKLAEKLTGLIKIADWAVFAKNGADVCTWATMVAREYTGKPKILMAKGGYHGTHAWCTPGHGGLIEEDRRNIHMIEYNNIDSVRQMVEKYKGQVAGIILTPYHHPTFVDSQLPVDGWWKGVREICDSEGMLLICDDVRAGFRLSLGGSHEYFGFEPDIACYCKAIGNGYAISAAVGKDEFKSAAGKVFLTGSYWAGALEMAAAMATIKELEDTDGVAKMLSFGSKLKEGLESTARSHGLQYKVTGPPSIPFCRFANENNLFRNQLFCGEATKRGAFFHPTHNWFISAAHTDKEFNDTMEIADQAFAIVKKEFGS